MSIEDEYLDVLQNIESVIVSVYREHPELTDNEVDKAFNALVQTYRYESKPPTKPVGEMPILIYERVAAMCDWRLGRSAMHDQKGKPMPVPDPIPAEAIVACLKRLRRSLEKWTKESGQQGYLMYISQFV